MTRFDVRWNLARQVVSNPTASAMSEWAIVRSYASVVVMPHGVGSSRNDPNRMVTLWTDFAFGSDETQSGY